jgi:hypothetical protein
MSKNILLSSWLYSWCGSWRLAKSFSFNFVIAAFQVVGVISFVHTALSISVVRSVWCSEWVFSAALVELSPVVDWLRKFTGSFSVETGSADVVLFVPVSVGPDQSFGQHLVTLAERLFTDIGVLTGQVPVTGNKIFHSGHLIANLGWIARMPIVHSGTLVT